LACWRGAVGAGAFGVEVVLAIAKVRVEEGAERSLSLDSFTQARRALDHRQYVS
jgi:hypothetical protein